MFLTRLVSSLPGLAGKRLLQKRNTEFNYLMVYDYVLRMT